MLQSREFTKLKHYVGNNKSITRKSAKERLIFLTQAVVGDGAELMMRNDLE